MHILNGIKIDTWDELKIIEEKSFAYMKLRHSEVGYGEVNVYSWLMFDVILGIALRASLIKTAMME